MFLFFRECCWCRGVVIYNIFHVQVFSFHRLELPASLLSFFTMKFSTGRQESLTESPAAPQDQEGDAPRSVRHTEISHPVGNPIALYPVNNYLVPFKNVPFNAIAKTSPPNSSRPSFLCTLSDSHPRSINSLGV